MQNTQWLAMVLIPLSLRLSLGLISFFKSVFRSVVLCLRPTPALGIKRETAPVLRELPGHPPGYTGAT